MDLLHFSKDEVQAALQGATKKNGGLNVTDIRNILAANGLKSTGVREELQAILKANFEEHPINYYMQEYIDERYGYGRFVKYTAYDDKNEVGYLTGLYHKESNVVELLYLYVSGNYRGLGIASKLLSLAIGDALASGAENIVVDDESAYGPNVCQLPVAECLKHNIYIKNGFMYNAPGSTLMSYQGRPIKMSPGLFQVKPAHVSNIPISEQAFVKIT